ncbi:MAG TPA: hypothetical protein DEF04_10715 [Clostridiales bacterium]|nr:hypothetical protein [Clostridiales bacterium]
MIRCAIITNGMCNNIVIFNDLESMEEFKASIPPEWLIDDLVEIPIGYGVETCISMEYGLNKKF